MKRDPEIIRQLMLKLEKVPMKVFDVTTVPSTDLSLADVASDTIAMHLHYIADNGYVVPHSSQPFIRAHYDPTNETYTSWRFEFLRISSGGHDFLDTLRNEEVWARTKASALTVGTEGLKAVLEIGKKILEEYIKEKMKIGK